MQALPIVQRELRVASRNPKTYHVRLKAAIVALLFGLWILFTTGRFMGPMGGTTPVFLVMTQLAFIWCLFAGMSQTSDCLSQEKREGTLGLLFLTDLRGYDVVLGKLLSASLPSFYALLATFPILSLPLLAGGVQPGQFWCAVLALANTLFFSLACGLFVSSVSRRQLRARHTGILLVVFFWLILPALASVTRQGLAPRWGYLLDLLSPGHTLVAGIGMGGGQVDFGWSLLATHLTAWAFLGLASWILPQAWQDKISGPKGFQWQHRWRSVIYGGDASRLNFRTRLLDRNAFYWLASRERLKPLGTWLLLGMLVVLGVWIWWMARPKLELAWTGVVVAIVLHVVLKLQFVSIACQYLVDERNEGTLELLLSTPLTVPQILKGQWMALRRQFAGPILAVLILDAGVFASLFFSEYQSPAGARLLREIWLPIFLAESVMLVADLIALGWTGMWTAMSVKQPNHAAGTAAGRILLLPWGFFLAFWTLILAVGTISRSFSRSGPEFWHALLLWFIIGIANNGWFATHARRKLLEQFRLRATERFQSPKPRGFWRSAA
ncbi:MAG: ABC transporter permease subunit [Verrucomicrobia bacterium]|nr:ABC transporter permease subunit [Verrucomicrobiota bacterium]